MMGDWSAVRRVLCVRLDSVGDVLMTTPALGAAKGPAGERHVTLLTSPAGAAVAELAPSVDDIIVYDAPWLKATRQRPTSAVDHAMAHMLRARGFDAAVVFTVFSQSALPAALLCYLADIPLRLAHARENPYQLLTTWVADPEPQGGIRHEVERQLALVAAVGWMPADTRLSLRVTPRHRDGAAATLHSLGIDDDAWVVLHPGATAPSRRYPPASFAAAARALAARSGVRIVVTGAAEERELVRDVCGLIGSAAIDLAGRLDLGTFAALVHAAPLVITNNTGPAHVAAAMGTPVVVLYALTNPQHTPWQVPSRVLSHDVPCRNCFKSVCPREHHACLRLVPPSAVAEAALELLQSRLGASSHDTTLLTEP